MNQAGWNRSMASTVHGQPFRLSWAPIRNPAELKG
jgi:hypothetical protein